MNALAYALQLLAALPQLIQAGADVMQLVTDTKDRLQNMQDEGREPSEGEWDDLNARIDLLRGELHASESAPGAPRPLARPSPHQPPE